VLEARSLGDGGPVLIERPTERLHPSYR
jgi:hypothetical protein